MSTGSPLAAVPIVDLQTKRAAHTIVKGAIKDGRLIPQPCERCGTSENVIAHHEDYRQALVVTWLCKGDHARRHLEMNGRSVTRNENQSAIIRAAVRAAGGTLASAVLCGVYQNAVMRWIRVGRILHAPSCAIIAAKSGVPFWKLAGLARDPAGKP